MTNATAKERAFKGISIRTDEADLEGRLDRVSAELTRRAAGVQQKRASVAKACLERGLDAIEQELGLA